MKKQLLFILLTLLVISGCRLEEFHDDAVQPEGRAFSVGQAKEFFEKDFAEQLTKSAGKVFRGGLHPGEFTPLWDEAVYSESSGVAAYDVDILAGRSIVAIRSKFGPDGARAERLPVYQKLVVRRNVKSGSMASYVLSLIPDVGCDDLRIPQKFRSRGSDKGGFSGIAVYTTPDRGALVRVQEYRNGVLVRGVYIPSGQGSYVDRCRMAAEILGGMVLLSRSNVRTRSGEDYYEGELEGSVCTGTLTPQEEGKGEEEDEDSPPDIDDIGDTGDVELPEDDLIEGGVPEDEEQEAVNQKAQVIIQNLGNKIGTVKVGLSVSVGTPQGSPFGGFSFSTRDIFEKTQNYTIVVAPGLSEVQKELVLAHEFMHLCLLQISQNAGSGNDLAQSNPELLRAMNRYGVNEGHHFYMGQHIEEMEQLLRDAFPGRDDDFYECGKWGGGALNSDAFNELSEEERGRVIDYLSEIGLYF